MVGANVTSQPSGAELKNAYTPSDAAVGVPTRPRLSGLIDALNTLQRRLPQHAHQTDRAGDLRRGAG